MLSVGILIVDRLCCPCGHGPYLVSRAGVRMSNRTLYHSSDQMFALAPALVALARLTQARGEATLGCAQIAE